ncbi:hypothetical protein EL18_02964 [Nitratireductor basaltis]|uniref:C-type lysozyme inhibitor domain-containing protein n=1 Tax=Nitratireductor basaltis TaxID=472175 RepID=A0A084U6X4_9HYPH|nr:hypothetical protein EL18_02964 [Nitratireductor basaltis]
MLTVLSGCAATGSEPGESGSGLRLPVTFHCDGGRSLTISTSDVGGIRVLSPRGQDVVLFPSPPDQDVRFQSPPYAINVDPEEALWIVTGKRPLSCKR